MTKSKIYENINFQDIDTSTWPTVLVDNLPEKYREKYLINKLAVDMYLENYSIKEIHQETKLERNVPLKLLKKCLETDENGELYGYKALIPYSRTSSFARDFSKLLDKYPDLKEYIHQLYHPTQTFSNIHLLIYYVSYNYIFLLQLPSSDLLMNLYFLTKRKGHILFFQTF